VSETSCDLSVLDAAVRIPEHVVFRSFAAETVALNLRTGKFHGLNATAGRMVELVQRSERARDAVPALAEEYATAPDRVERDLAELLTMLLDRELILLA
jgi:hypothetical protein